MWPTACVSAEEHGVLLFQVQVKHTLFGKLIYKELRLALMQRVKEVTVCGLQAASERGTS